MCKIAKVPKLQDDFLFIYNSRRKIDKTLLVLFSMLNDNTHKKTRVNVASKSDLINSKVGICIRINYLQYNLSWQYLGAGYSLTNSVLLRMLVF